MKIKTKKMLTLAMSAVLILSSLPTNVFSAHSESQKLNQAMNSDVKVSGSIGSLISDELQSGQKENSNEIEDYAVYDVDYDPDTSMINVSYGAKSDCTLFVGFYNDDCTELIYSKTVDLEANYISDVETAIPVTLPDYYLIKCFIVDDMKRPLCKAKTNDRYTKAVQDILEKKYDDKEFDQNNVVFFEENDKSNFFVAKQELHSITSTDNADHYIENVEAEEKGEYSFEKIDKIADLKKGDEVVVYTDNQNLLFIIDKIKIEGDKATITSKDCELEDLCSFIKLDSSTLPSAKEVKFEIADEFKEQVDCEIVEDPEAVPFRKEEETKKESDNPLEMTLDSPTALAKEYKDHFISSITIALKDLKNNSDANENLSITGQITFYNDFKYELYLSKDYKALDLKNEFDVYIECEGNMKIDCPIFTVKYPAGFIVISSTIDLFFQISGKVFAQYIKRDNGIIDSHGHSFDSRPPEFVIDGISGYIDFGIEIPIYVSIIDKRIISLGVSPKAGIRASFPCVKVAEDDGNDADPDTHPCGICIHGPISCYLSLSGGGEAFGKKITLTVLKAQHELGECYCSAVLGFGFGECPNKGRSESLSPVDKLVNPFGLKAVDPTATATGAVRESGYVYESKYPTLTYDIYPNGTVVFYGEGDIKDFRPSMKENENKITRLVIESKEVTMSKYPTALKDSVEIVNLKHSNITEFPDYLFLGCHTLKKVFLPESLTSIGFGCFDLCENIEEIRMPSTVTSVGDHAFEKCTSLKEVELSPNLTSIGAFAFASCTSMKEIEVPSEVTEIGIAAFASCSNLKTVNIVDSDVPLEIKERAFVKSGLTSIVIPERTAKISGSVFKSNTSGICADLKSVTINGDYEGDQTFSGLTSIESVKFGDKVTKINMGIFHGCTNITEIEIPENITMIGGSAFENTDLKKVVIPENVTQIGTNAFYNCGSLTDIYILNREAVFGAGIIDTNKNIKVYGYKGSTAEELAKKTKNIFVPLDGDDPEVIDGIHISTGHSDDTSTPQKMEYTLKNAEPEKDYIFMIVGENDTIKTCIDNAIYTDQQTSDADGNVTFIFNKPVDENVTYIIANETEITEIEDIKLKPIDNSIENSDSEETNILFGDSNGDGQIDMSDAVIIMQMLANPSKFKISPEFEKNADVYQPGTGITTKDALSIQKYLLSLIPELPED